MQNKLKKRERSLWNVSNFGSHHIIAIWQRRQSRKRGTHRRRSCGWAAGEKEENKVFYGLMCDEHVALSEFFYMCSWSEGFHRYCNLRAMVGTIYPQVMNCYLNQDQQVCAIIPLRGLYGSLFVHWKEDTSKLDCFSLPKMFLNRRKST